MAVQLNNAPAQQDFMQVPQPQTSTHQPAQPARSAAPEAREAAGARDASERGRDFQNILNTIKKTTAELSEKETTSRKAEAATASGGTRDADAEPESKAEPAGQAQDLSSLVNPLMKGMEHLKQLIESMQAELKDGDVKGAFAVARNAAAKVSRFDPDLVLGKDFVDGSLGKKLQERLQAFLAGGADGAEGLAKDSAEGAAEEAAAVPDGAGQDAASLGELLDPGAAAETAAAEADAAKTETAEGAETGAGTDADKILPDDLSVTAEPGEPAEPAQNAELGAEEALADDSPETPDAPKITAGELPEALAAAADELSETPVGHNARRDRGLEKLAKLADELVEAVARHSPELAEQLRALRDAARDGLTPEEADKAAAALEKALASFAEAGASKAPAEGYEDTKENDFSLTKALSSSADRSDRAAASRAQQRSTAGGWDLDRKSDAPGDLAPSLSASLNSAASEAFEVRSAADTPLGQAGVSYVLDPNDAFGDGITKMLQFLRDENIAEARIVVEPPALGRIDISLQATAGGVEAVFKVDNEHLKQVLQQQLDSLKSSLQAQGIHVSGLTVDIKNRDDQRRQNLQEPGRKVRRLGIAGEAGEAEGEGARLVRLDLEKGMLHWVA